MILFFKYFWFFAAAFMLANVAVWRFRLAAVVNRGIITQAEADQFIRWVSALFVGAPLLLGVLALAAHWSSPFCAGFLEFDTLPRSLVAILTLGSWLVVLWWIWRGKGGEFLARVGPGLSKRPSYDKPFPIALVRLLLTAMILGGPIAMAIARSTKPQLPEMACVASDRNP